MTEGDIRELFREMRAEPVPADSLARVRTRVDERMRRRGWGWAALAAAAAAAVVLLWVPRPGAPLQPQTAERLPLLQRDNVRLQPAVMRWTPRRATRKTRLAETQMTIRMETADPDVVILLVGN